VALDRSEPLSPLALRYLNRLSDLLFVLARVENRRAGVPDVEWEGRS
jgi:cob(I)alamin adenosyltransferase